MSSFPMIATAARSFKARSAQRPSRKARSLSGGEVFEGAFGGCQAANTGFSGPSGPADMSALSVLVLQVLGDFGQERGWLGGALPCAVSGDGWHAQVQLGPGACHAYIR